MILLKLIDGYMWFTILLYFFRMFKNSRLIYREPPVKGRKLGLKSMIWNRREKQEPPKNEERLWNLGATLSVPTSES